MTRKFLALATTITLAILFAVPAHADTTTDPVGFCPPIASVPACTTATAPDNETIAVGTTSIGMEKNGSGTSASPWYLIVALPNYTGSAPTVTITGGTLPFIQSGSTANDGNYTTSSPDLYTFTGTTGDASMNESNMFGTDEQNAFGGTPSFFDVFVFTFNPGFDSNVPYTLDFGSALPNGTFLAASGGSNPFSTPFTTTGLVSGPSGNAPEPGSLMLLGTGLFSLVGIGRRKLGKA